MDDQDILDGVTTQSGIQPPASVSQAPDEDIAFLSSNLPDYEDIALLHRGGQAAVYWAVHRPTEREVAIKVLLDGPFAGDDQRHRIQREARYLSRLRHPHIVTIYDAGVIRGRNFLVMEYVDGRPIHDFVVLKNLRVREIVEQFVNVCDAIAFAHQHGIIHRDIKPSNIVVNVDGVVKVLDFGFACSDDTSSLVLSGTSALVGTLAYLSPERIRSDVIDAKGDVYGIGMALYETLTDALPFDSGGTREHVLHQVCDDRRRSLREGVRVGGTNAAVTEGDIDDDLEKLVAKAIAVDPEMRYANALELKNDLERYQAGEAISAKSGQTWYVLRKGAKKYRTHAVIAAVLLLMLVGALVITTTAWQRARRAVESTQAALQMAGIMNLGSVDRDAGRIDKATRQFEQALAVGQAIEDPTDELLDQQFDAHYFLAETGLMTNNLATAAEHGEQAMAVAKSLMSRDPGEPRWRRNLAFAFSLNARLAQHQGDWNAALKLAENAHRLYEELRLEHPDNPSIQKDCAYTQRLIANALRRTDRPTEAMESYEQLISLYTSLASQASANGDDPSPYLTELARTRGSAALIYVGYKNEDGYRQAIALCETARNTLTNELSDTYRDQLAGEINPLLQGIEKNLSVCKKKLAALSSEAP